jgi:hypothetical protein
MTLSISIKHLLCGVSLCRVLHFHIAVLSVIMLKFVILSVVAPPHTPVASSGCCLWATGWPQILTVLSYKMFLEFNDTQYCNTQHNNT